jgi:hypothetical protein
MGDAAATTDRELVEEQAEKVHELAEESSESDLEIILTQVRSADRERRPPSSLCGPCSSVAHVCAPPARDGSASGSSPTHSIPLNSYTVPTCTVYTRY